MLGESSLWCKRLQGCIQLMLEAQRHSILQLSQGDLQGLNLVYALLYIET